MQCSSTMERFRPVRVQALSNQCVLRCPCQLHRNGSSPLPPGKPTARGECLNQIWPPSAASISNTHSLTSNLPLSIYVYSKQFLEFGCKVEPYINSFHIPLSLILVVESESTIFYGFIDAEETSVAQFLHDLMRRVYLFFLPLVTMLRDKTYV